MTQYVRGSTTGRTALAGKWGVGDLRKRPQVFSGHGVYEIKLFADDEPVIVPTEPFEWPIPPDLHLAGLIEVYAAVSTVSSGDIELEVVREPAGGGGDVSMFSSNLVIASGNKNSDFTDGTVPVDVDNAQVSKGDHLRCDIIDPGSGAMGLALICVFLPDTIYEVIATGRSGAAGAAGADGADGADGAPGGITAFTGEWVTATAYTADQSVSHLGSSYAAIDNHTSGGTSEPGVGANWEDHWQLLAAGGSTDAADITITDTGSYFTGTDVEAALQELGAVTSSSGWIDDSAATWTRTANTTFTVSGDRTAVFSKGTRLRWTQTTVKYGTVIASSHSAGTTTVTIATTTDYVLTAAAISANSYSYAANPQDYPGYFNYTPTWTGYSSAPSGGSNRFCVNGRTCHVVVSPGADGTSNATTKSVTIPIPASASAADVYGAGFAKDNGTNQTTSGLIVITASATTAGLYINMAAGLWTGSGSARSIFQVWYEI